MGASGRLIYVTGPSRTGVRTALRKYVRYLEERDVRNPGLPRIVELERHLEDIASDAVQHVLGRRQPTLFRIMQLPKALLNELWLEAFELCLEEAKKARAEGHDVLLTFHAVWYHHQNREYVSAVNFARLQKRDAKADLVLTLIDDIYDVRARLSEQHGLFEHALNESLSELEDMVLKLLLVLDWRTTEVLISEKIASLCTPCNGHFVLAVKHPLATLHALLQAAPPPTVYLAHPISEPKMMQRLGVEREAQRAMQDIQDMAAKLRESTVLFEPTAIDEARLVFEVVSADKKLVVPLLGRRWPLAVDEQYLLFVPPSSRTEGEFGTQWVAKSKEVVDAQANNHPIPYRQELRSTSGLLRILQDTIVRHINQRDHKLIDQADHLVVWRPYFRGKLATGVQEELQYHDRLFRSGKRNNAAIVFHPAEDERGRPREAVRSFLSNYSADEAKIDIAVQAIQPEQLTSERTRLEVGRHIRAAAETAGINLLPPQPKGALQKQKALWIQEQDEQLAGEFRQVLRSYLCDLTEGSVEIIEQDLKPLAFAERAVDKIRKHARVESR